MPDSYTHTIEELARNAEVFRHMLSISDPVFRTWQPAPDKWCLLEIVCHLHDEELEDWHVRTQHVLEQPDQPFVPIDPASWVVDRAYMAQDYDEKLAGFLARRAAAVRWLRALESPKWDNVYQHVTLGPLSASMFLANWLAHDYLHMRQISKLKYQYLAEISGENMAYAGGV